MSFKTITVKEDTKANILDLQITLQAIEHKRLSLDAIIKRLVSQEQSRIANSKGDNFGRE